MRQSHELMEGSPRAGRVVPLLHLGFLLIGVVNTLLGPILPLLSARWQLDDAGAGALFFLQSAGAIAGSALSGPLIKRLGFSPVLAIGFGLMSIGTAGLGFGAWTVGAISISVVGLSLGLTIPTINLLISELNVGRRAAALNLLNLAWGMGAVSGPALIPMLTRGGGLSFALLCLAASVITIAVLIARSPFAKSVMVVTSDQARAHQSTAQLWMSWYPLLTAALVFVNIGTESAIGGWIASYVQRLEPTSALSWAAPSFFWGGLLTGRAVAPIILRHVRETKLMLFGISVAICGLMIIVIGTQTGPILVGVSLAGLGLSPIFPTTIALFTERYGHDARRLTGILFILAGMGAAVLPWLVGFTSSVYGELRAGLVVPLVGAFVMLFLHTAIMASFAGRARASS